MTRFALVLGCALLLAACFAGNPQASGTPGAPSPAVLTAAPTTAAATPSVAPTAAPTVQPTPTDVPGSGLCPTDSPLTPLQLVETASACFGRAQIQVRGWLDGPPSIGFEPPTIKPTWLYYPVPQAWTIWEQQPAGQDDCSVGDRQCAWFFPHINPTSGLTLDGPPRWLILTGHFDDPAAVRCHWVYPDDTPPQDRTADDADAVALCRGGFIVDSFVDAP
jgi:hypothetical protein